MARSITSANAVFMLVISGLYDSPQQIQGFASDDAFMTEDVDIAETSMGVDGKQSGGYTPYSTKQTITLQADSLSVDIFENWQTAQKAIRDIYYASAVIDIAAVAKSYTMTGGILTRLKPVVDAKKVLQPRAFQITWEGCLPAPLLI